MKQDRQRAPDRLDRPEEQVRGIARMVEQGRSCVDIRARTTAARFAIKVVERLIVENHAHHCVVAAIDEGDPAVQREKFDELIALLQKTRR